MDWIYLSPHVDDVAMSCGGLLWEQNRAGQGVEVWTICAGNPPSTELSPFAKSLHERWGIRSETMAQRRAEDRSSCVRLGAIPRHFPIPDCIYRRAEETGESFYVTEESLFGPLHPAEGELIQRVSDLLAHHLSPQVNLVSPLALRGHVDHRLTRSAAETLRRPLWYYLDYPYILESVSDIPILLPDNSRLQVFPISDRGLETWQDSVAAHASQISTFWPHLEAMREAIRAHHQWMGGVRLWKCS